MAKKSLKSALQKVTSDLKALSVDEFNQILDSRALGDVGQFILDTHALETEITTWTLPLVPEASISLSESSNHFYYTSQSSPAAGAYVVGAATWLTNSIASWITLDSINAPIPGKASRGIHYSMSLQTGEISINVENSSYGTESETECQAA